MPNFHRVHHKLLWLGLAVQLLHQTWDSWQKTYHLVVSFIQQLEGRRLVAILFTDMSDKIIYAVWCWQSDCRQLWGSRSQVSYDTCDSWLIIGLRVLLQITETNTWVVESSESKSNQTMQDNKISVCQSLPLKRIL